MEMLPNFSRKALSGGTEESRDRACSATRPSEPDCSAIETAENGSEGAQLAAVLIALPHPPRPRLPLFMCFFFNF